MKSGVHIYPFRDEKTFYKRFIKIYDLESEQMPVDSILHFSATNLQMLQNTICLSPSYQQCFVSKTSSSCLVPNKKTQLEHFSIIIKFKKNTIGKTLKHLHTNTPNIF